jgi:hypothetical protein
MKIKPISELNMALIHLCFSSLCDWCCDIRCTYKLQGDAEGAVYNSILDVQEKQRVDNMTWGQLITYLRGE